MVSLLRNVRYLPLLFLGIDNASIVSPSEEHPKPKHDDCAFLDTLPELDVPDYITCKDYGSQEKVLIIWDLEHNDPLIQEEISDTVEELHEKAGFSYVVREGRLGFIDDVLTDGATEDWTLPKLQEKGITFRELIGSVEEYATVLSDANNYFFLAQRDLLGKAQECYEKEKKETCFDPKRYDTRLFDYMYDIMKTEGEKIRRLPDRKDLSDLRNSKDFAYWFNNDVAYYAAVPFRSYNSVDRLLELMTEEDQDTAVLIFGNGHMLQIEGYLDQMHITHAGIFVPEYEVWTNLLDESSQPVVRKADYKDTIRSVEADEERHFSQDGLDLYRYLDAKNAFDMTKYKE